VTGAPDIRNLTAADTDTSAAAIDRAVNARNESALGLYESEGFVRSRTRDRWARHVRPGLRAAT
jgi:hypothetical protein